MQGGAATLEFDSRHGLRVCYGDVMPSGSRSRISRSCLAGQDVCDRRDCRGTSAGARNRTGPSSLSHESAAAGGGYGKRVVTGGSSRNTARQGLILVGVFI